MEDLEKLIAMEEEGRNGGFWDDGPAKKPPGEGYTIQIPHKLCAVCCGICSRMLNCPVTTPCGHSFCADCLSSEFSKQIARRAHRYCPTCSSKLQAVADRLRPSDALNYIISALGMTSRPPLSMEATTNNLNRWQTSPSDVTRMEAYVGECIEQLRAMRLAVAASQAVKFEMGKYEEGWWTGRGAQHEADYMRIKGILELNPDRLLYDAIMAPAIPFHMMTAEELGRLHQLPIHAIAAQSAIVIIAGRPCDTKAIMDTMTAWGFTYRTIIATVNFRNPRDPVKQIKTYNRHKSRFFHAGSIAPVQSLSTNQKDVLVMTTHEFQDMDTEFYDQLNKTLSGYVNRVELFNPNVVEGWDQLLPQYFSH